jgi:hypothetical protein
MPLHMARVAIRLVIEGGLSLRSVPRVMIIVAEWLRESTGQPLTLVPPDWTTIRNWVLRLGYAALSEPKPIAADWAYLVDHTVQIGPEKCLVIYGVRLSQMRWDGPGVRHEELQMIGLVPMSHSNRQRVCQELEAATKRTGVPREIVSDGGTDIKGGVEDFRRRHQETAWIYDMAHKGACLLQRRWERDPRWSAFLTQVGRTKAQVQQTELAYLAAPSVRPKSRYMNLGPVLRWARLMLNILDRTPATAEERERMEQKLGWLREYRAALGEWLPQYEVVQTVVRWVRQHGVYQGLEENLRKKLDAVASTPASGELAEEFIVFLSEQAVQARPGERLLGSTESMESCFGKWKMIERQQSKQGFTRLVLGLGAIVSDWPIRRILEALARVPLRSVRSWCSRFLGPSIQAQRRIAYVAAGVNESGMKAICCQD